MWPAETEVFSPSKVSFFAINLLPDWYVSTRNCTINKEMNSCFHTKPILTNNLYIFWLFVYMERVPSSGFQSMQNVQVQFYIVEIYSKALMYLCSIHRSNPQTPHGFMCPSELTKTHQYNGDTISICLSFLASFISLYQCMSRRSFLRDVDGLD